MPDLPYGFDRADGTTELPGGGTMGTPTPAWAINVSGAGGAVSLHDMAIEELPDSPEIERSEQATITKTFRMSWEECLNRISVIGRGTIVYDTWNNYYLILSASIKHESGGTGLMTIVMEAKTFDSPPDEFSIIPVELGINIIKHPRYFYAFLGDGYGSSTERENQMVIRLLQDYMENTSANYRDAIVQMLTQSLNYPDGNGYKPQPPAWDRSAETYSTATLDVANIWVAGTKGAKLAALEIIQKWWRGEETPPVTGYEVSFSQYHFISPPINAGGVIENPMTEAEPQLPEYFYSRVFPPNATQTIFDYIAAMNPQCYSSDGTPDGFLNISWLRKPDQVEYQRTWFKLTRTWLGSPVGFWDEQIFSRGNRPDPVTGLGYIGTCDGTAF